MWSQSRKLSINSKTDLKAAQATSVTTLLISYSNRSWRLSSGNIKIVNYRKKEPLRSRSSLCTSGDRHAHALKLKSNDGRSTRTMRPTSRRHVASFVLTGGLRTSTLIMTRLCWTAPQMSLSLRNANVKKTTTMLTIWTAILHQRSNQIQSLRKRRQNL